MSISTLKRWRASRKIRGMVDGLIWLEEGAWIVGCPFSDWEAAFGLAKVSDEDVTVGESSFHRDANSSPFWKGRFRDGVGDHPSEIS